MTPVRRAIGLAVLAAAAMGVSSTPVSACTCISSGPPCQAYFQMDAVFVGTVRSIERREVPIEGITWLATRRLVHMSIDGPARGVQGTAVDVWTGAGGGDCGYDFKPGARYIVYAYKRPDGAFATGICSRTRPIEDAGEDLAFISGLGASASGARVFGRINHWENDPATGSHVEYGGVPDVQVLVRGAAGTFSATTDAEGRYAVASVPPGSYEVEALPPSVFSRRQLLAEFEIKDARACRVQDFSLHYAGRITGTILDTSGQPAADVRVEIAPAARPDEPLMLSMLYAKTDGNGRFDLGDLPPGSYVVGVGFTPEMNAATVYNRTAFAAPVDVGKGSSVEIGALRLPSPARRYELRGVAVSADGTPLAGASVFLVGARGRQVTTSIPTAADGSFTLPVYDGQSYTLRAYVNVSANPVRQANATQTVTVAGEPSPVRIVLVVR